jgi:hypothetical protein
MGGQPVSIKLEGGGCFGVWGGVSGLRRRLRGPDPYKLCKTPGGPPKAAFRALRILEELSLGSEHGDREKGIGYIYFHKLGAVVGSASKSCMYSRSPKF